VLESRIPGTLDSFFSSFLHYVGRDIPGRMPTLGQRGTLAKPRVPSHIASLGAQ
jgi:hypothetical protein